MRESEAGKLRRVIINVVVPSETGRQFYFRGVGRGFEDV